MLYVNILCNEKVNFMHEKVVCKYFKFLDKLNKFIFIFEPPHINTFLVNWAIQTIVFILI